MLCLSTGNVAIYTMVFAGLFLLANYGASWLYSNYCVPYNFWNILFVAGSPVCQTLTLIQVRTLELWVTIWYAIGISFATSLYTVLSWVQNFSHHSGQNKFSSFKKVD